MLQQTRALHTTRAARSVLDYFRFFKKKQPQNSTPASPSLSTEEVVAKQDSLAKDAPTVTILGRKNPRYTDKAIINENLNGFVVSKWIPKNKLELTSENYTEQITSTLKPLFKDLNSEIPITEKLPLFKSIQKTFSISIPDYQIAHLSNFNAINAYLISKLNPALQYSNVSEFTPNAIDLPVESFKGTNVHIGKHVFEAQKRKAYKKLLKKAASIEKNAV